MEITHACCVKVLKSFGPGPFWNIKKKKIVFPSPKFKRPQIQFWSVQTVANSQQHEKEYWGKSPPLLTFLCLAT